MGTICCYFLIFVAEAWILRQYTATIFKRRQTISIDICVLLFLYSILFACSFLEIFWLNTMMFFVCNSIYIHYIYDISYSQTIFHAVLITVIMCMCELLVSGFISRITPNFYANATTTRNLFLLAIFSKLLYSLFLYLLARIIADTETKNTVYQKSSIFLLCVPVSSIIVTLTIIKMCEEESISKTMNYMIILCAFLQLCTNLLVFGIHQYNQGKAMEYTNLQLMLQKETSSSEYYRQMLKVNENHNILIHDITKHLNAIAILNEKNEREKIKAYINQLFASSDLKKRNRLSDNPLLNIILNQYQAICEEKHITFLADIRSEVLKFVTDNDLITIFCNLLDNAVEASWTIPNAIIECSVFRRENTAFTVIMIVNSCRCNPIKGNHELVTKKENKYVHGFGMKSIERAIKEYDGEMTYYYDDNKYDFHTVITLKCPLD